VFCEEGWVLGGWGVLRRWGVFALEGFFFVCWEVEGEAFVV
jgi:hypothetical protein